MTFVRPPSRHLTIGLAGALVVLLSAFAAPVARMHLALRRAEPGVNDTITTSPSTLKLWFTESIKAPVTAVRLTDAANHLVKLGNVTVDTAPRSPAVMRVDEPLKPGTYTVTWRTMSADGHPTNGKFAFTLRAAH